jgi:acetoin utilization deacetylase AcuC-like enzyme
MLIIHDPRCAEYGSSMRPEQPARVTRTSAYLHRVRPAWNWREPRHRVDDDVLRLAHTPAHLKRLGLARDFDPDTPFFCGIAEHARRSVAAALEAAEHALTHRTPAFSLMRPPGHHATAHQAMGFCYLNQVAIAALAAQRHLGAARVAVWDPDAHHGNGTEAILHTHHESGDFSSPRSTSRPAIPAPGRAISGRAPATGRSHRARPVKPTWQRCANRSMPSSRSIPN